ncbi:hypothetical protein SC1083_1041 [Aggregatibacter actinomycetemcomitans serotype e str. SC1083]|uniref:Uncharacterized protein n=1 Tax=Aggregatibacter actinomycetemcomitans serotype e str. SC1083 TaxID=907488 RepID=G4A894_AGGAC|nr:hypothetical protein SC1083_1041 [Aggregatibacter actinomycetemcomitans serotype e str. SC1083]
MCHFITFYPGKNRGAYCTVIFTQTFAFFAVIVSIIFQS